MPREAPSKNITGQALEHGSLLLVRNITHLYDGACVVGQCHSGETQTGSSLTVCRSMLAESILVSEGAFADRC